MSGWEIGYLVGTILTGLFLIPLGWTLIWQIKMRRYQKNSDLKMIHQVRGLNRFYHSFLFYVLVLGLVADVLGFIILMTLLVVK